MLKSLDSYFEPDSRFANIASFNEQTKELRLFGPKDLHEQAAELVLNETIPEKVRHQFHLALNVYQYRWFVYDFATVAELQAYCALEAALRHRYFTETGKPAEKPDLKSLFDFAIAQKWLDASDFELPMAWAPQRTFSGLDMLRVLRNKLAHGRFHLMAGGSYDALRTCHFIISQLFGTKNAKSV